MVPKFINMVFQLEDDAASWMTQSFWSHFANVLIGNTGTLFVFYQVK